MNRIHVTPLAFESLGVRSMCTFVETQDVRVLIDPGAALGQRFRLLPHPQEYEALNASREKIRKHARSADILTVSHYHHDHFTPNFTDTAWLASSPEEAENICRGKTVMVKDVRSSTNLSQRRRGWIFQSFCRKIGSKTTVADGRSFQYGNTTIRFSIALPHGMDNSDQGWVLATVVELPSEKFIHASDVQGPMSDSALRFIIHEQPSAVVIGGPPTYLSGFRVPESAINRGLENLAAIARRVPLVIVDHHFLRAEDSLEQLASVSAAVKPLGHSIMTAAEHLGQRSQLLEAKRRILYEEEPPSERFLKWTKLSKEKQQKVSPPLKAVRRKRGVEVQEHARLRRACPRS